MVLFKLVKGEDKIKGVKLTVDGYDISVMKDTSGNYFFVTDHGAYKATDDGKKLLRNLVDETRRTLLLERAIAKDNHVV